MVGAANLYAIILDDGCLTNLNGFVWAANFAIVFKFFCQCHFVTPLKKAAFAA
jgi:hypothetical protein